MYTKNIFDCTIQSVNFNVEVGTLTIISESSSGETHRAFDHKLTLSPLNCPGAFIMIFKPQKTRKHHLIASLGLGKHESPPSQAIARISSVNGFRAFRVPETLLAGVSGYSGFFMTYLGRLNKPRGSRWAIIRLNCDDSEVGVLDTYFWVPSSTLKLKLLMLNLSIFFRQNSLTQAEDLNGGCMSSELADNKSYEVNRVDNY